LGEAKIRLFCPAKVNLTLHVGASIETGRWRGYHPVESLVVFADVGDTIEMIPSINMDLWIEGMFSYDLPVTDDNLILRAMGLAKAPKHRIWLDKRLPISSGLGGGSANAAAVLREFDPNGDVDDAALGADIPVCRLSRTAMMEGIGEQVTPLPGLGQVPAILVNPGVPVSTGTIFKALDATPRAAEPNGTARSGGLIERALSGTNEMQDAAIRQAPVIADVIDAINAQSGCQLARMSGSGASCFGLFETMSEAKLARDMLRKRGLWAVSCHFGDAD
jgi:4-diphosphocytidyl-2-C-methyl-D-erythritol kinase